MERIVEKNLTIILISIFSIVEVIVNNESHAVELFVLYGIWRALKWFFKENFEDLDIVEHKSEEKENERI